MYIHTHIVITRHGDGQLEGEELGGVHDAVLIYRFTYNDILLLLLLLLLLLIIIITI